MKILTLFVIVFAVIVSYWFLKTNNKDIKARKEAIPIEVTVQKLRCKQRLKGDKSLVILSYKGKSYSVFVTEKECFNFKINDIINAYYSITYDKLFLNK